MPTDSKTAVHFPPKTPYTCSGTGAAPAPDSASLPTLPKPSPTQTSLFNSSSSLIIRPSTHPSIPSHPHPPRPQPPSSGSTRFDSTSTVNRQRRRPRISSSPIQPSSHPRRSRPESISLRIVSTPSRPVQLPDSLPRGRSPSRGCQSLLRSLAHRRISLATFNTRQQSTPALHRRASPRFAAVRVEIP